MKRAQDAAGRELLWTQPSAMKRVFELKDGDDVVASLAFKSSWGSLALAQTADGSWSFKRVGFWSTRVTIRVADSEEDLATYHNATWTHGGTLELPGGRRYRANTNFWNTKFFFRSEDEKPLVTYEKIGGMFHLSAKMTIDPAAAGVKELPWIVALGWYIAVKMRDDAAGVAAGAAAAAG